MGASLRWGVDGRAGTDSVPAGHDRRLERILLSKVGRRRHAASGQGDEQEGDVGQCTPAPAIPTTGRRRASPPVDPSKAASPKAKTPPSEATSQ